MAPPMARIRYTKGEIGDAKVVADFLPPPDQLVLVRIGPTPTDTAPSGKRG